MADKGVMIMADNNLENKKTIGEIVANLRSLDKEKMPERDFMAGVVRALRDLNEMRISEEDFNLFKQTLQDIGCTDYETFIEDAYKRLMFPSIERNIKSELFDRASLDGVKEFGINLENLLLTPPIREAVVLGFDPAFRTPLCLITFNIVLCEQKYIVM